MKEIYFLPEKKHLKKYVVARSMMGEYWFMSTTDNVTEAGKTARENSADIFESQECVEQGEPYKGEEDGQSQRTSC